MKAKDVFECGGTGFRGRSAISELLDLSDNIRDLILNRRPSTEIRRRAREEGMTLLFLERGDSLRAFSRPTRATEGHSLFARPAANLGAGPPIQNQVADVVAQIEQFGNGAASAESRASALETSFAFIERHIAPLVGNEAAFD